MRGDAEIARLRRQIEHLNEARENWVDINAAAGKEIERLRAENVRLRELLSSFVRAGR